MSSHNASRGTLDKPLRRRLLKQALGLPWLSPLGQSSLRLGGVSMLSMAAGGYGLQSEDANAAVDCEAGDARSLVCVFLAGGADSHNLFVPVDARYDTYRTTRNDLAVPEAQLLEVNRAAEGDTGEFAFHALLPSFHRLYNDQALAVVHNVGPLLRPTTQGDYRNRNTLPESLFAHDAQQKLWQTAARQVSGTDSNGWGNGIAEQIATCNLGAGVGGVFSVAGANPWQSGRNAPYVSLSPNADIQRLYGVDASVATWIPEASRIGTARILEQLQSEASDAGQPVMLNEAANAQLRAQGANEALETALDTFPLAEWQPASSNRLERQLHLVARLIAARSQLGMGRQIFFVRMGGWDTHSNQNERLPLLLNDLDRAIGNYQTALDDLALSGSVTTFTASDFGRTLTSNGNGTDHGWGGNNFVFGGAVRGGRSFGSVPSFARSGNPDDAGDSDNFAGRIIPTLSVNQYGATLARWMGVAEPELFGIFPDLVNFDSSDLGFMA